ncbi:uncharacterized protein M421DRAFT_117132 [Didymella exigua CBS 183.55]|uniref:Uncharacterized protein n=1 Tax=Didymella exigua CBS 183.55 TaxID=1150837 RepID=A0A6A5S0N5_9PLEO|nr:uncharacterized protein M421DRAFT_117132 [Didymella exigua CBS 183.55]KAF1934265.1 hypothetical protein M421DRAFT_117132 [Didymella exigua CBS 183.55]
MLSKRHERVLPVRACFQRSPASHNRAPGMLAPTLELSHEPRELIFLRRSLCITLSVLSQFLNSLINRGYYQRVNSQR